jgi:hypothetical protein
METKDEWGAAPKDGTAISAQFPDGTTAKTKWNHNADRWEVLRSSGEWVNMRYEHGVRDPAVWWTYHA